MKVIQKIIYKSHKYIEKNKKWETNKNIGSKSQNESQAKEKWRAMIFKTQGALEFGKGYIHKMDSRYFYMRGPGMT